MVSKNYETRHVYMALGIVIAIFAPIFLIFVPKTVAEIIHFKKGDWGVLIPDDNFTAFGMGCFIIVVACMLLFILDIQKFSIILSVILALLSFGCFFIASQSYVSLSDENISYTPFYSIKDYSYRWQELEKVIRIEYKSEEHVEYELVFKDGNHMNMRKPDYLSEVSSRFHRKLGEMNIKIERVEEQ